ncbi:MAG: OmpA family protein [Bacteroidales bacterium]|nr:OmpA family protein [Bacteroidales bacterium]
MCKIASLLAGLLLFVNFSFAQNGTFSEEPFPISENINSTGSEHLPNLTTDGKTLYFCGTGRDDNIGLEDVFVSHFENGEWSKPKLITELSTSTTNDAPLSISADENSMIVFRDGKIYSSNRTKDGWTEPKLFNELNYKGWNCDASYTADGNAILFASGTWNYGTVTSDIYVLEKQDDGSWSEPINLGDTINAGDFNRSPFLHPDMKTLYFSTNGYEGEGGLDIYKTTRLKENSWTEWSKPVNLGKNINTDGGDWALKLTTNGKQAIYNISIDSQNDIYLVNLNENIQPDKVVTVSGVITDKLNNPIDAEIVWEDLETGEKKGALKSNPSTGEYVIILPLDKNYGFFVSKENYYPLSDNIDLRGEVSDYEIVKDFVLLDIANIIEGKETIQLKNLFFETDKYKLKKESFPELDRLADFVKENPNVKIEISGHTDNIGSDGYNMNLSQKRAYAVQDYLIMKGCDRTQMTAVGYGERKPLISNDTPEGRAKNRRVEFRVIK